MTEEQNSKPEERKETEVVAKPKRRGPKVNPNAVELARLQRENKRLKEKLERAELIIDVQKKVARLIGETPPPPSEEN